MNPSRRRLGLIVVLVLVCLIAAALVLATCRRGRGPLAVRGGAVKRPRPSRPEPAHIVVDTLNLAHWLRPAGEAAPLSLGEITAAIDRTAPELRRKYPGRVMYVLKDQETVRAGAEVQAALKAAAHRNRVYIYLVERYEDPPRGVPESTAHSARGRDDFYIALLAWKWRCPVATEDRLREFEEFRRTLQPFRVVEWAYFREGAVGDSVRPESPAYSGVRRPRLLHFAEVLPVETK